MKLPFREHAFVPAAKLVDYLLSPTHPVGKSKAQFFAAFGFDAAHVADYGEKNVVQGILQAADGRRAIIETVWIIEPDQDRARFVTAYPA